MAKADFFHHEDGRPRRFHLLGVCGSGMKPLAMALKAQGIPVSGSDIDGDKVLRLQEKGIAAHCGHDPAHSAEADCFVYSTAVSDKNPEIIAAKARGAEIVHRGRLLAEFLRQRESILVAGTHGKTTTTSLLSLILTACGADPWCFIGGHVPEFGGNLRAGGGRLAAAEADESDGSFLELPRQHAIVTNIEAEHLNYWKTEDRMFGGFRAFVDPVLAGGVLIACGDDPGVRRLLTTLKENRAVLLYGIDDHKAVYTARKVELRGRCVGFDLCARGARIGRFEIGVPGRQNVANSLAALAMGHALGLDVCLAKDALRDFHGADRRFTMREAADGFLVIDDYAHHPTEIRATLAAGRTLAEERGGRLFAVFQPHRYTRLALLKDQFTRAFPAADELLLLDVYAAGEEAVEGLESEVLADGFARESGVPTHYCSTFEHVSNFLRTHAKERDIVLLLGAGSITKLADQLTAPKTSEPPLAEARH